MGRIAARWLCALLMASGMAFALSVAAHAQPPVQTPAQPQPPAGAEGELVEIRFAGQAAANRLAARLDVWEVDHEAGTLVAFVSPQERAELRLSGYAVRSLAAARTGDLLPASIPNFTCYRTVEETYADLAALALAAPGLAEWVDIGDSWRKTQNVDEGYDLHVLVLTNEQKPGPKPRLFVMAAIHARELTTAEVATRFAEQLVAAYGHDPDVTFLLDYTEIHLLPQANPDGRKRAEADAGTFANTLWRKNVNNLACADDRRYGVDLNRNSSFRWATCEFDGCSSSDPCNLTYHGVAPASEPETQAIEAYLRSLFPDRRGPADTDAAPADTQGVMISLHSYSQLVLFPWGWRAQPSPNDAGLRTLGRKFGYFTGYETCQSGEDNCIYRTDGTTDDFSYGELGVASYTFELGTSFFEACSIFEVQILPGTLDALLYAAKAAVQPYTLAAGPDVVTATVTPAILGPGSPLLLTAQLDDSRTLSQSYFGTEPVQAIAGATYTVDAPSWIPGASPGENLQAVGVFDTPQESATAAIDTAGWTAGRHTIFVQATDAAGHVGPPTAVFVEIGQPVYVPFLATGR